MPQSVVSSGPSGTGGLCESDTNEWSRPFWAAFMWAYFFSHGFHQEELSLCLTSLSSNFNINSSASSGSRASTVASWCLKQCGTLKTWSSNCLYMFSWRNSSRSKAATRYAFASACICFVTHRDLFRKLALQGPHKVLDLYSEAPSEWVISLTVILVCLVHSHVSTFLPPHWWRRDLLKEAAHLVWWLVDQGQEPFLRSGWTGVLTSVVGQHSIKTVSATMCGIPGLWFKSLFYHILWDLRNYLIFLCLSFLI